MSIEQTVRIINREDDIASGLEATYASNKQATDELRKFRSNLKTLNDYLRNLEQLKPNYSTNDVNEFSNAINLHLDLLKEILDPKDYNKLSNGMKAVKTILKFHPSKYSFFTYIIAWLVELFYFI